MEIKCNVCENDFMIRDNYLDIDHCYTFNKTPCENCNSSLILKNKWFDMIKSGQKKEEYREIKPYYVRRMFDFMGIPCNYNYDYDIHIQDFSNELKKGLVDLNKLLDKFEFKPQCINSYYMHNGYRKDRDSFLIQSTGFRIDFGKEGWGAEPGKRYFVIELGEIIKKT